MVQLTPEQQAEFINDHPQVFSPAAGKWGQNGSTIVKLSEATKPMMQIALEAAWKNASSKAAKRIPAKRRLAQKPTTKVR